MKIGLTILITISLLITGLKTDKVKVLVLPPFDEIANAGGSPDTQKIIETVLAGQGRLSVIPFPLKKLMGVPYQMVFDKKYCKPILDKVDCDVIIMTQLITKNEHEPGIWPWTYKIKIYNVQTGRQLNSIQGDNLKDDVEVKKDIVSRVDKLIKDIEQTFKTQ
ncbi:MAG: hypothetical protein JSS79_10395 [Bacteroidetes bacterium]|nr:hypothetical protein [Bacteroidota bacterium]